MSRLRRFAMALHGTRLERTKKVARDVASGLAITGVLFLLLEGALWALGVGAPGAPRELSRGFDPRARYFVPDPEREGVWITKLHGQKTGMERRIHPKRAAERVLLFGGSNTQALDAQGFAWALNRGRPEPRFEVINLGREGYGSERVSILFGQALALLEPDVAVIYAGHNEFVERGFQMDLERRGPAPWLQGAARLAARTRTFNVMVGLFEPPPGSKEPEDWEWEYGKFEGLRYDETLRYYDAYERNLRRMVEAAEQRGVRVLLSTVVHNRLAAPFVSNLPRDTSPQAERELRELSARVAAELPPIVADLIPLREEDRVHGFDWEARREELGVTGPVFQSAEPSEVPARRAYTGPFEKARPGFPPPELWHPKVRPFYLALERFFERRLQPGEREALDRADAGLDRLLELCPDHPRTLFARALVDRLLERDPARYRGGLELAARFDRAPRKASEATNERVRAVARDHPDVLFVDVDALFSGRMPDGVFGWDWMIDHCHLNQTARLVLLYDWADAVLQRWPGGAGPR